MKRIFSFLAILIAARATAQTGQTTRDQSVDTTRIYQIQQIVVTATRADRTTPTAYTDIGREQIAGRNFGADIPSILQLTPSVVATSDSGNGIGGTAIRIRGADASRINVTTNGVPMNDSESHAMYWYDTPDLVSSTGSIQVQRGAGTSTNGTGAFGGSVNMSTAPLSGDFHGEASVSYGSYNTNKQSLQIGSGLLGRHWIIDGRLSHIGSDGYVDRAATDLKAYMLQAGYYKNSTMVKLISFGGIAKVGLAYTGVTKDRLKTDRRYNPEGEIEDADGNVVGFYGDQTDNYTQINNQLVVDHRFNSRWSLNATAHYTYGLGWYNQYKNGTDLAEYGLDGLPVAESNLVRRKSMGNHFGGVVASANYTVRRLAITLGGAASVYDGEHWGNILQLVAVPDLHRTEYYRNASTKWDANLFAKANWEVTKGLNLYADLQYRLIKHDISGMNDNFNGVTQTLQTLGVHRTYRFFNPKGGVQYTFAKHHRFYASFAVAQKEPNRSNFADNRNNELPKAERLHDWEFGYQFDHSRVRAGVNFYYMTYRDQLVATGELSDTGEALVRNIPDSYRRGIELTANAEITRWFSLGANATLSQNRIENYAEFVTDYDLGTEVETKMGTSTLSYSPSVVAGTLFDFHVKGFSAQLQTQYVGEQYFTNGRNADLKLDDYCVTNLNLGYELSTRRAKSIRFGLQLNNLFNTKYCNNGYGYSYISGGTRYDDAFYFPQATFNLLANVTVRF